MLWLTVRLLGALSILVGAGVLLAVLSVGTPAATESRHVGPPVAFPTESYTLPITAPRDVPMAFDVPEVSSVSKVTPERWVAHIVAEAGLVAPMKIEVTDKCGPYPTMGCTGIRPSDRSVSYIRIAPWAIGTDRGKHTVLHELGHAAGNFQECAADDFAHAHGSNPAFQSAGCIR